MAHLSNFISQFRYLQTTHVQVSDMALLLLLLQLLLLLLHAPLLTVETQSSKVLLPDGFIVISSSVDVMMTGKMSVRDKLLVLLMMMLVVVVMVGFANACSSWILAALEYICMYIYVVSSLGKWNVTFFLF